MAGEITVSVLVEGGEFLKEIASNEIVKEDKGGGKLGDYANWQEWLRFERDLRMLLRNFY